MSRIPPEHEAARSLEASFRRLGEERAAARRPRRSPRPFGRVAVTALAVLLGVSAAAAGTKVFMNDGGTVGTESRPPGSLKRAPADRRLAQASVPDPTDKAQWGLRLYTNAGGDTCVVAGRRAGGRIGVVGGGSFAELPASAPGTCTDLDRVHVLVTLRRYGDAVVPGGRTVVYGVTDRTTTSLAIRTSARRSQPLPIAPDGTFIAVLNGAGMLRNAKLVIDGAGGRSEQALRG
jgi:hypothetical protein